MILRLEYDGAPLLACPECGAALTTTDNDEGVLVFTSDGNRLTPTVDTVYVALVPPHATFPAKDADGYEFDAGAVVECECHSCGRPLTSYTATTPVPGEKGKST